MLNDTYYGSYRTRTFSEIFDSFDKFKAEYEKSSLKVAFSTPITDETTGKVFTGLTLEQFYYMMYAHYGNSHIAYSDENQFKYYMYTIMYQEGPTVIRQREVREQLLALGEDELINGGKAIYNHSFNPSTLPSTSTLEELTTINDQNTTNYKKSKIEGYTAFLELIDKDPIDEFIHKFRRLFIKVLAPDYPLLYKTYMEDN